MNGAESVPAKAKPRFFSASFLTMCRKLTIGILMMAVAIPALWLGREELAALALSRDVKEAPVSSTAVRVVSASEEVVTQGLRYSGVAKEIAKAELSFRVAGTVESLHEVEGVGGKKRPIHEGDVLSRGTVLALLDESDYRRDRDQASEQFKLADARWTQAKSEAELRQLEIQRAEQLFRRGSTSVSELDTARMKARTSNAQVSAAEREHAAARIALAQAEARLGYCALKMPFERGTIAARRIEANEQVTAGQLAFQVLDLSSLVIAFGVPDTLLGKLSMGMPVEVTADAFPDQSFLGVIHKIGSSADPLTRSYSVEVRIDEPKGLRPGMVATVTFRQERRAVLLPLTAIAKEPEPSHRTMLQTGKPNAGATVKTALAQGVGHTHAFPGGGLKTDGNLSIVVYRVVRENNRDVVRPARVICEDVLDNRVVARIVAGEPESLQLGDRIVAGGVHRLNPGKAVTIVD